MKRQQRSTKFMRGLVILVQVLASFSVAVTAVAQPAALTPLLGALSALLTPATAYAATGATPPTATQINGLVWLDADTDGVNDSTEIGLAGATVTLFNAANAQVGVAVTTPATGLYSFTGLSAAAGPFRVQVSLPSPYLITVGGADNDVTPVSLAVGERTGVAAGTQVDAAAMPSWVSQTGRFGTPGYQSGTAPFDTVCPVAGSDCSATDNVVRSQDSVSFAWSVTLSNNAAGTWPANMTNGVFEQTFVPSTGANILPPTIPSDCNGTGNPANRVTVNADRSITLICNMGIFTTGSAKVLSVSLPVAASAEGSTITSTVRSYASNTTVTGGNATTLATTTLKAVPSASVVDVFTITTGGFSFETFLGIGPTATGATAVTFDHDGNTGTAALQGVQFTANVGIFSRQRMNEPIAFPLTMGIDLFATTGGMTAPFGGGPLQWYITNPTNCRNNTRDGNVVPHGATTTNQRQVVYESGSCALTRATPADASSAYTMTINGLVQSAHFPTYFGNNATLLPTGVYFVGTYAFTVFVPNTELDRLDGVIGNSSAGASSYADMRVTNFNPVSTSGQTNDNGAGTLEPGYCASSVDPYSVADVTSTSHCQDGIGFVAQTTFPGITRNYDNIKVQVATPAVVNPTFGVSFGKDLWDVRPGDVWNNGNNTLRAFPAQTGASNNGEGVVLPDDIYQVRLALNHAGTDPIYGTALCDVFDNATQRLVPASAGLTGAPANTWAWFSTLTSGSSFPGNTAADWQFEFGSYDLTGVDQAIGTQNPSGRYPGNWSTMQTASRNCLTTPPTGGWYSDPTLVPGGIDAVNAVRVSRVDPNATYMTDGTFSGNATHNVRFLLQARDIFSSGPYVGNALQDGTVLPDMVSVSTNRASGLTAGTTLPATYTPEPVGYTATTGSSSTGDRITIGRKYVNVDLRSVTVNGVGTAAAVVGVNGTGNLGLPVIWEALPALTSLTGAPITAANVPLQLDLPAGLTYDPTCSANVGGFTPDQVLLNTPSAGRVRLVWTIPLLDSTLAPLQYRVCMQSSLLANSPTSYSATATILQQPASLVLNDDSDAHVVALSSSAQLEASKAVNASFDTRNDNQQYTLGIRNRSTSAAFNNVSFVEVFPYNGDETNDGGVTRDPASDFTPSSTLALTTVPVATYPNATGAPVAPMTFTYTADPHATVSQNPNTIANNTWCSFNGTNFTVVITGSTGPGLCPTSLAQVTAIRGLLGEPLLNSTNTRSTLTIQFTLTPDGNGSGDLYSDRFVASSTDLLIPGTTNLLPLLSNQTTVRVLSFVVGDRVWFDRDNNGRYSTGDGPAPDGVILELWDAGANSAVGGGDDTRVYTTTTTTSGSYLFGRVDTGNYFVRIPASQFGVGGPLAGYKAFATQGSGDENDVVSQDAISDGAGGLVTRVYALSPTVIGDYLIGNAPVNDNLRGLTIPDGALDSYTQLTADFGLVGNGSLGDRVWNDRDRDGVQDAGEAGLVSVPITATWYGPDGVVGGNDDVVYTTTTDLNGGYLFADLPPGVYSVTINPSAYPTFIPTYDLDGIGTSNRATRTLAPDENATNVDFGLALPPVRLGNRLWSETDNDGDASTGTVTPVVGQVVTATLIASGQSYTGVTDANGIYTITVPVNFTYAVTTGLPAGVYDAPVLVNDGSNPAANNNRNHKRTGTTVGITTTDNLSLDFGFFLPQPRISVVKFTNGADADTPPGPSIDFGDGVTWTYHITNTGNVTLTNITLADSVEGSVSCPATALAPGLGMTCSLTATATADGQYANTALVAGTATLGSTTPVTASNPSHYFGMIYPPTANDDEDLGNTPGTAVTLRVLNNDTIGSGALVTSTVQISGTANAGDPLVVPGEGTWSVNLTTGAITFTPEAGFTGDPTPIQYTVADENGKTANPATVTVDYIPVATNDASTGNTPGVAVTIAVTANDTGGDSVDPTTVQLVGADAGSNGITNTVPGEGVWTVNPTTGAITFTPEAGFTGDPTPIQYTVEDGEGNTAAPATVTVDYVPVATNDASTGHTPGAVVTLAVTANDTTGDSVDPTTVQLVSADAGSNGTTKTVPGEGAWTVNSTTGAITFTPEPGFTGDPTPIQYTVEDDEGNISNPATVTVDYLTPPTAIDDEDLGNVPGTAVTLSVLTNDTIGSGALVTSTVQISGTPNAGDALVVAGEGTWSVNSTTGEITFTPEVGFTGDPTPIQYTVTDANGLSATASVTVDYVPVASADSSTANMPGSSVTLSVTTNDTGGDSIDPTTVQLVGADAGSNGITKTVPGEGTWTVNPTTGAITFTPEASFTGDPTPIQYTVEDDEGNTSNAATVTVDYLPVASADSSLGNMPGSVVTIAVTTNDTGGDSVDPTTVQLVGADAGSNGITKTVPGEGAWTVNPTTGAITFTPESGFTGDPTPIQYTVEDGEGNIANPAIVTVDYLTPPTAIDDEDLGNVPGTAVTLSVLTNDIPGSGALVTGTLQISGTTNVGDSLVVAGEGTWSVNLTTGEITFTPEVGFTGDPTPIQYTVTDTNGLSATATVTVDYIPVASDDSSTANTPGSAVTLTVTTNDTGGDSVDPTTVQLVGADASSNGITKTVPGEGLWTVNSTTGAITFTPEPGFTGDPTPIQYTVKDDEGNTANPATVTVDYIPIATNDTSTGNTPGDAVTIAVTANDLGGDRVDPSTVQLVGADAGSNGITKTVPGEGIWTVNSTTGAITFTPEPGFTGDPTPIQYTVEDDEGNTANPATVTVDYLTPPTAIDDEDLGNIPGTAVTLRVLGNDIPGSGALVTSTIQISGTANAGDPLVMAGEGTWSVNPTTGEITFTPEPNFTGDPTPIQYTVADGEGNIAAPATVTVDYVPVATDDASTGNIPGNPVTLTVTANDTVGDSVDPTTVQLVGADAGSNGITKTVPGEGTWTVNPSTGAITFTPEAGFTGDPTPSQYTVEDGEGNTANPATVTVDYLTPPMAIDDKVTVSTPSIPVTVPVLANDIPGSGALVTGTLQISGTANAGDPLTVLGEGVWAVNTTTGEITFTPEAGFTGDPTPIQYTVEDENGLSATATVTVDYVPVASADASTGNTPGDSVTIAVLANDTGGDRVDPTTVQLAGADVGSNGITKTVPGEGMWTVDPTIGAITFTPEAGFTGDPTPIQYTVKDGEGNTAAPATVTIDYIPVVSSDASTGNTPGNAVTIAVTTNDTGGDRVDPTTVQLAGADAGSNGITKTVPGEGMWTVNPTIGAITFTPEAGFTGDPTPLQYTVEDDEGNTSNAATVTVDYIPVATDDASTGNIPGAGVTIVVTTNDLGGDSVDLSTVQLVGADAGSNGITKTVPGEGTWTVNPTTGAITFTPEVGFTGDPTPIQYTVKDVEGNISNPATVTVDYLTPPTAIDDEDLGNTPGSSVTVSVLNNDIPGSGALVLSTVQISGTPNAGAPLTVLGEGVWAVDPTTGAITFTPEAGFTGDPTPLQYTVKDTNGLSATASVTVDYIPVASADSSTGHTPGSSATIAVTTNDTSGDTVDPTTVQLVGADAGSNGITKTVPGEGLWTVNSTTGAITFTPEAGFTGDPTPIQCTVKDSEGNTAAPATVTVDYVPVASADSSTANTPGNSVILNVTTNDTGGDRVDPTTVQLVGADAGSNGSTKTVPGEGVWSVNPTTGAIIFTPEAGFTGDPTPIQYTVKDDEGNTANPATVTVDYVPVATNDASTANTPGNSVTIDVMTNDRSGDPTTVQLVGADAGSNGSTKTVPGEGMWTVNPTTGAITFTPVAGFTGDPTPIQYTVEDAQGNTANSATVTISYLDLPMLSATKADQVLVDGHGDGMANPGDTLAYTITMTNRGNGVASNVVFTDTPDANTTLVVGSVQTNQGAVTQGNTPGDTVVGVNIGTLPAGGRATIRFAVTINNPLPAGVMQIANQGFVGGDNLPPTPTDDPDSPPPGDATITPVTVLASLGGYVWLDQNLNGLQEANEQGSPNIVVRVYSLDGTVLATTTTDAQGHYHFTDLPPGQYYIGFVLPPAYSVSPQHVGTDDTQDSDVDVITGHTQLTTLGPGQYIPNLDAGLFQTPAALGEEPEPLRNTQLYFPFIHR